MKRKMKVSFALLLPVLMLVFASFPAFASEVPADKYAYSLSGEVGTQSTRIELEEFDDNQDFRDILAEKNDKIVLVKDGAEIKFTPKEKMPAAVSYYTVDGAYGGALFWTIDGTEEAVNEIGANQTATTTLHKNYGGFTGGLYFVFEFGNGDQSTKIIYMVSDGATPETTKTEQPGSTSSSETNSGSNKPIEKPDTKPMQTVTVTATASVSKVKVDGKQIPFEAYNINNNTYFKLRDIAMAVNGTDKTFEVGWNSDHNAINLISGEAYTAQGGELAVSAHPQAKKATLSSSKVFLDDEEVNLTAYTIGGNNYFKLRDIAEALGISITFDSKTNTIGIVTNE
ncbi:MAG: stalk domain-containing protein [Paenibacillus sp.]|uniref:stalk domain-containing protein n=1 Tax=Paenibacillus sp. TaxID=58172 RepID=UPI00290475E3|nr:stalk domain-containing protein [Paenibacillus sp.]MDU2243235.1 stalk domain-containing protein [Paenibacillus sp.]